MFYHFISILLFRTCIDEEEADNTSEAEVEASLSEVEISLDSEEEYVPQFKTAKVEKNKVKSYINISTEKLIECTSEVAARWNKSTYSDFGCYCE